MKKSLKLLLLFLILGLSFILTACEKEYIKYTLLEDGSGYYVTGYVGDSEKIVIPSKYKKLPVTGISDYAFTDCDSLVSVTFGPELKRIGEGVFKSCDNLEKVVIPSSVKELGWGLFDDREKDITVYCETGSAIYEYCQGKIKTADISEKDND